MNYYNKAPPDSFYRYYSEKTGIMEKIIYRIQKITLL